VPPNPPDNTGGLRLISRETGAPAVDLASLTLPLIILDNLHEDAARRLQALPLRVDHGHLFIAIADPNNGGAIDEISFLTGKTVVAYAAHPDHLMQAIEEAYAQRRQGEIEWRGWKARTGQAALALQQKARRPEPVAADTVVEGPIGAILKQPVPLQNLNLRDPFSGEPSYHPTQTPTTAKRQRPRLLVVEDEEVIRRIVIQALSQRGYELVEAATGIEGLRLVKEKEPDAILLDALLPDVHGFDICKRLKASRRYGHIPIVMMTAVYKGWRMAADLKESYGVSAIVEKPFDLHLLTRAIEDALTGRAAGPRPDTRALSAEAARLFADAQAAYKRGDLDHAISALSSAVAVDPLSATLRHQLGLVYAQKQHDFAAIQELEMAVDLEPDRFPVLRNLAVLYQRRGFRRKACEMWERALAQAPDEATKQEIKSVLVELL
jgi:DNA-binding response OmpR family regulator